MAPFSFFSVPSKKQAIGELFFAAVIWGFSFVATRWALQSFAPMWVNTLRFALGCLVAVPFLLFVPALKRDLTHAQFRLAMVPGIFLGMTMTLQTFGLVHTSVTKSSFITVLYIVFVPLFEWLLLGRKVARLHWLFVSVALTGAALICRLETGDWNRGDVLTLGCAITAALHILQLEISRDQIRSSFNINVFQSAWGALLPTLFAVPLEYFPAASITPNALWGLAVLSVGSTLLAFTIQVRAQRALSSPATVSMFFLLESPFAAVFAYYLFDEKMVFIQWVGAALILLAAIGTIYQETKAAKEPVPSLSP